MVVVAAVGNSGSVSGSSDVVAVEVVAVGLVVLVVAQHTQSTGRLDNATPRNTPALSRLLRVW